MNLSFSSLSIKWSEPRKNYCLKKVCCKTKAKKGKIFACCKILKVAVTSIFSHFCAFPAFCSGAYIRAPKKFQLFGKRRNN